MYVEFSSADVSPVLIHNSTTFIQKELWRESFGSAWPSSLLSYHYTLYIAIACLLLATLFF
jgi:hypothetical protein